ncbi:MAG: diaminopimelate decarboxylase, partial [Clostridia bacterium]|nr:diaminopimelate decarboxylase [Clostridia bacterium]
MYVSDCVSINERGHLTIGNYDTVELIKKFGSPLYAFDENEIRKNIREFKKSIDDEYDGNGLVIYASKAFCCKEMIRLCDSEGAGVDVVSGGELYTALSVDFPPEKIVFHGNNKTYDELVMAVDNNVGRVIVDNITELNTLNTIAAEKGKTIGIMLRIKPGIDAHTHSFVKTGQIDSKFGFALETGEAMEAIKLALGMSNVRLRGLHCHIG